MFHNANNKLEDSRHLLDQLKTAKDAISFRSAFNSFLNAARAITYAFQKDADSMPGFDRWYETKQNEMKNDELLRFIHEARTDDFHEGKHRLNFGTHLNYFAQNEAGPPPSPSASMAIGHEGPFWIVNQGTPQEKRIPINKGGSFTIQVSITDAPIKHLGKILEKNDPITICELALDYYSNLIYEAKSKFKT